MGKIVPFFSLIRPPLGGGSRERANLPAEVLDLSSEITNFYEFVPEHSGFADDETGQHFLVLAFQPKKGGGNDPRRRVALAGIGGKRFSGNVTWCGSGYGVELAEAQLVMPGTEYPKFVGWLCILLAVKKECR